MSSFLVNCTRCKNLIARDTICPNCNFGGEKESGQDVGTAPCVEEFARRRKTHNRNSGLSMVMKLSAGFLSLVTAILWAMFLYRGNVVAFVGIGFMTVMSGIFGWVVIKSDKYFPVDLKCPNCEQRLDQLNVSFDRCANCNVTLT